MLKSNKVDIQNQDPTNMGVFLKFEIRSSLTKYQELLRATQKYRQSIQQLSEASSEMSKALEELSQCKGSDINGNSF